jgi:PiT family inorganic phosphate transporter
LTGALLGSGLVAAGGDVNLRYLGTGFLLPLAISPILAVVGAGALYLALRTLRQRLGISKEWCLCVGERLEIIPTPQPPSAVTVQSAIPWFPEVSTGTATMCTERYAGRFLGIRSQSLVDGLHFVSAGIVSFARGLNDTPKIVAVLMATQALNMRWGLIAVAVAMAAGGWLNARKVAETMSHRITPMNHGQGFAANVVTALLVILASTRGLPVSTTHVSVGSLFGIGLTARTANVDVVARIVLSWVLTLPCAALFSGMLYWVLAARQG